MDDEQKTQNRRQFLTVAGTAAAVVASAALPEIAVAQNNPDAQVRTIADKSWNLFQNAWATGEWQPFLDTLTDDFTFWFTQGDFKGRHSGRTGKEMIVAWANFHRIKRNRVKTVPTVVSVGQNCVVYENESESIPPGSYKNWEAVVIEVRGDKVSALREYWGNLTPFEIED